MANRNNVNIHTKHEKKKKRNYTNIPPTFLCFPLFSILQCSCFFSVMPILLTSNTHSIYVYPNIPHIVYHFCTHITSAILLLPGSRVINQVLETFSRELLFRESIAMLASEVYIYTYLYTYSFSYRDTYILKNENQRLGEIRGMVCYIYILYERWKLHKNRVNNQSIEMKY